MVFQGSVCKLQIGVGSDPRTYPDPAPCTAPCLDSRLRPPAPHPRRVLKPEEEGRFSGSSFLFPANSESCGEVYSNSGLKKEKGAEIKGWKRAGKTQNPLSYGQREEENAVKGKPLSGAAHVEKTRSSPFAYNQINNKVLFYIWLNSKS